MEVVNAMRTLTCSDHAVVRLSQRGFGMSDLDLALAIGTEVEGGILVLRRDCDRIALELRALADRVARLAGLRVVAAGDTVVTAYRAAHRRQKRLLRNAEQRNRR